MAQIITTNNDIAAPTFCFHQTTFGQNIRLENNATKAVRYTSFDHGKFLVFFAILNKFIFSS